MGGRGPDAPLVRTAVSRPGVSTVRTGVSVVRTARKDVGNAESTVLASNSLSKEVITVDTNPDQNSPDGIGGRIPAGAGAQRSRTRSRRCCVASRTRPKRVRTLEERLLETKGQLAQAVSQNEKLSYTLREARDHIQALRDEVDKLTQPPAAYATLLDTNEDGTVDVFASGRKMRVEISPNIDRETLRRGQEVVLNESFNVVMVRDPETAGEVVQLKEVLADGQRALVVGRADEERVAELGHDLLDLPLRAGDTILMDIRSGVLLERLPRPEVEELVLEEVPDISYEDIGGLDEQIEQITDAVELPFLHQHLFADYRLPAPEGHPPLRPSGMRQDADRQGGRQLARQEGHRGDRARLAQLLPQHQGPRAPQQVRRRDRAPHPPRLPAGAGEGRGRHAGHRVLRRDGVAVPHPRHGHLLRHGVDDRAAAAGRDRRRRDAEERDRDRRLEP